MKKILVIPDSVWGNDSGHRSTQFLLKKFIDQGHEVAVYAESNIDSESQRNTFITKYNIEIFDKKPYSFLDQFPFFKRKSINEFKDVLDLFKPELILYFGTIRNKVSIDYLNLEETNIPYAYLPLTNEFWCMKNFAGLKSGECFKCMNHNFFHSVKNNCLETYNPIPYLKGAVERTNSKKRLLKSNALLGYTNSQIDTFEMFGYSREKTYLSSIFFEPKDLKEFTPKKGDYFLLSGQITEAKGWHLVPDIISLNSSNEVKFKLIIYDSRKAEYFIQSNNLQKYLENGKLTIESGLESHSEVLKIIANSYAVIIPSNYPTTGEFALLEAMGLSKPVIAFDVGAHSNILQDKFNSLVSSALDVKKMARDIELLSKDEGLWKHLSANSLKTFKEVTYFDTKSLIETIRL